MKFVGLNRGGRVFEFSIAEVQALEAAFRVGMNFQRPASTLSKDDGDHVSREAREDLEAALAAHRKEAFETVLSVLRNPARRRAVAQGCELTLTDAETETLLQALNQVRVGAWEGLGRPGEGSKARPNLDEHNVAFFWALQVTDLFQGLLLSSFADLDISQGGDEDAEPEP
jgi:hypothetical protein